MGIFGWRGGVGGMWEGVVVDGWCRYPYVFRVKVCIKESVWLVFLMEGWLRSGQKSSHFHARSVYLVSYVGLVRELGCAVFFGNQKEYIFIIIYISICNWILVYVG